MNRLLPRALLAPAVVTLFLWMIVPLLMTIYFSAVRYNLMQPGEKVFIGLENFSYFVTDPDFGPSVWNTLVLLGSVILITVILGVALALLVNDDFPGRGIVRVLLISPFFVMPTANALLWKHMMMNPVYGVLAQVAIFFGATPVDWLTDHPLFSVILMVAWQWLPFACLIFITSLQSLDRDQMEAAGMDGANPLQKFWYLTLPHLGRPIAVVDHDRDDLPDRACSPRSSPPPAAGRATRARTSHVPDLQAGADELRRRRRVGRRAVRCGAGQHRRVLPGPHDRQEPRLMDEHDEQTTRCSPSVPIVGVDGRRCWSSSR